MPAANVASSEFVRGQVGELVDGHGPVLVVHILVIDPTDVGVVDSSAANQEKKKIISQLCSCERIILRVLSSNSRCDQVFRATKSALGISGYLTTSRPSIPGSTSTFAPHT